MALYNVGIHYFAGKGTAHSFEKAAQYFHQAADVGFTPAQVPAVRRVVLCYLVLTG